MTRKADQNARVLDQFSQQAEAYAALVNKASGPAQDPLIAALAATPTDRVLDVGCGSRGRVCWSGCASSTPATPPAAPTSSA